MILSLYSNTSEESLIPFPLSDYNISSTLELTEDLEITPPQLRIISEAVVPEFIRPQERSVYDPEPDHSKRTCYLIFD